MTTKCITDDLLLTFVNKIWVQPFELVLEIHNQLPDLGQNCLDNNLQTTFLNKFSSVKNHIFIFITLKLVTRGLIEN